MSALIISKFPDSFVKNTIARKLAKLQIQVSKILHPSKVSPDLDFLSYDFIFIMNEMMSHSEYYRIKGYLEKINKKFFYLSRKSSSWDWIKEIPTQEPTMKIAVQNNDVENVLRDYLILKERGTGMVEIAKQLSARYWKGGEASPSAVAQFIRRSAQRGKVPAELSRQVLASMRRNVNHFPSIENPSEKKTLPEVQRETSPTLPPENKVDWEDIALEYEQENARLKREIQELRVSISSAPTSPASEPLNAVKLLRLKSLHQSMEAHLGACAIILDQMNQCVKSNPIQG